MKFLGDFIKHPAHDVSGRDKSKEAVKIALLKLRILSDQMFKLKIFSL